jgi:uncharacterized membrane protein
MIDAITMQESVESTAAEMDEETASTATGLAASSPAQATATSTAQPTATSTLMPTEIVQPDDGAVQRAAAATESPMQPAAIEARERAETPIANNFIGLLSLIMGVILLIVAIVTTLARRRREIA